MKKIYLLLFLGFINYAAFGAEVTVANAGSFGPVAAANVCVPISGSINVIIQEFTIATTVATDLTQVKFTTTGTYTTTDVTTFYLYSSSAESYGSATYITSIASAAAGTQTINITAGTTGATFLAGSTTYFWIVAQVQSTAVVGHTITVAAIATPADITVTGGATKGGASAASGTQTFDNIPTAVTASATPNPLCSGANLTLTGSATSINVLTYSWSGPGGYTSAVQNPPAFGVTTSDDGIYSVTATNACGSASASTASVTVNPLPDAITGNTDVCIGTTSTLADASGSGTWLSVTPATATITAGGVVTGDAVGTTTIIFTLSSTGCQNSTTVTVSTTLPDITGITSFCEYTTTSLSDPQTGGAWSSSATAIATIDPALGVADGISSGTAFITYTYSGCTTTTEITVNPVPAPGAVTGIGTICVGGSTVLTDTPPGGDWVSGDPLAATIDESGNVLGVSAGTSVMTYNLTNDCGTTGATYVVTVEDTALPITADYPNYICIYNELQLYDAVTGGTWSASNSNATVNSITGLVAGAALGLDTITYTLSNVCGTTVAAYQVTIGMPANWGIITGPNIVCSGSSVTMTETVTGGYWASGPGFASVDSIGPFTSLVTGLSAGIDSIYYVVTAPCGQSHATQLVTVDDFGTPFVSITGNPGTTSCESESVTYTANPSYGGTAPEYIWYVNGAFVSTGSSYTYVPSNGDLISCDMTSNYPCANVPTASNFVYANVIPLVVPTIQIAAEAYGDTVCAGTTVTFLSTITNGGTTPVLQWSVNGINTFVGASYNYAPDNGDVVTCKVRSDAQCPIPDSAVASVTMTVNTTELPVITIDVNPSNTVCFGTLVTYTAHYIYGGVAPSFLWIKNGVSVATGVAYSYNASNLDTISCEFFSDASCASPSTVLSNSILMHTSVVVDPVVILTANPGTIVPYGSNVTLTGTIVSGAGANPTYQWVVNGVLMAGATNSTYNLNYVTGTDIVSCDVTGSGNCPAAETVITDTVKIIPSGIKQISTGTDELILAPNPNNGIFTLYGTTANEDNLVIEITDIVGQVVYRDAAPVTNGIVNKQINLQGELANGFYLLHIIAASDNRVIRFTLNR